MGYKSLFYTMASPVILRLGWIRIHFLGWKLRVAYLGPAHWDFHMKKLAQWENPSDAERLYIHAPGHGE